MDLLDLSSEDRLLLYCARTSVNEDITQKIKEILDDCPDWDYIVEGSMDHGILWDPGDAGFAMTWIALQLLEGKEIKDGMKVPGMGKTVLDGDVIKVDAMIDITGDNADDFGF